MKKLLAAIALLLLPASAYAHHGGVTLAFGPGSPIETNSPMSLPEGGLVSGIRAEQVAWQKVHSPEDKSSFTFLNANLSYGFTPALTGTLAIPYYIKRTDDNGENQGVSDIKLQLTYGFHYDQGSGFARNSASDTAVSMDSQKGRTWLAASAMVSLPTGKYSERLDDGVIDPGMQAGFGAPAYTFSLAAARAVGPVTINTELSADFFQSRDYKDENSNEVSWQFGSETRVNLAGVYELYGNPNSDYLSQFDAILELNYLHLGRDQADGKGEDATGGDILYLSPGVRLSMPALQNANLGLMVKFPFWKSLNEQGDQQGAEGLERFRVISTLSFYF